MRLQSHNPMLTKVKNMSGTYTDSRSMTIQGAVNKTFILFILLVICASATWIKFQNNPQTAFNFIWPSLIAGFIFAMITVFKPNLSPYTGPLYAVAEGLLVGTISAAYNHLYQGIVPQAVFLTFAVLFLMLFIYKTGIIKVTKKFAMGVAMAGGAIFLVYIASWIIGMFGVSIPLFTGGPIAVIFSFVVVIVASLFLLLDFEMIVQTSKSNMPKYMEWYCAFSLMVTLVWLYLEILRLLSYLNRE